MKKNSIMVEIEELSFETAFSELVALVEALETGEYSLDVAMEMFERGQVLSKRCTYLLEKADLKIQQINGDSILEMEVD
jgi:exodeoxyribonuclease VII small subunit